MSVMVPIDDPGEEGRVDLKNVEQVGAPVAGYQIAEPGAGGHAERRQDLSGPGCVEIVPSRNPSLDSVGRIVSLLPQPGQFGRPIARMEDRASPTPPKLLVEGGAKGVGLVVTAGIGEMKNGGRWLGVGIETKQAMPETGKANDADLIDRAAERGNCGIYALV